ncbi:MAG: hypothetical protein ACK5Z2_18210 [Bacteroidota bacterium]|jgi:hypothetical protein
MLRAILILLLLTPALAKAQVYLAPSPSAEDYTFCPYDQAQLPLAYPWFNSGGYSHQKMQSADGEIILNFKQIDA